MAKGVLWLLSHYMIIARVADSHCTRGLDDQDTAEQVAALKADRCGRIYREKASSGRKYLQDLRSAYLD